MRGSTGVIITGIITGTVTSLIANRHQRPAQRASPWSSAGWFLFGLRGTSPLSADKSGGCSEGAVGILFAVSVFPVRSLQRDHSSESQSAPAGVGEGEGVSSHEESRGLRTAGFVPVATCV